MRHLLRPGGDQFCVPGHNKFYHFISPRYSLPNSFRSILEASSRSFGSSLASPLAPPFLFLPPPPQQRRFMRHNDQLFCRPGTLNSFSLSLSLSFLLGDLGIEDSTARPDLAFTVDVESSRAATSTQLYRRGVRVPPRPRVLFSRG